MKKTLIVTVIALLAGAVSGYSQGQVFFYNYETEGGTTLKQAIFDVQPTANDNTSVTWGGYTVQEEMGSTSASSETPKGTTVYSGTGLLGTGYEAQMLASPIPNDTLNDLVPVGNVLPFFTIAAGAGYLNGMQIVTVGSGTVLTVAIAVWNNGGGQYTTLAEAQAAGEPWGISNTANDPTAVVPNLPTSMPTSIESFSLGGPEIQSIPEPGTIALGALGASAFLFRRRQ
jgi:hypothetical protein